MQYYDTNSELLKERSKQYYIDHNLEIKKKQRNIYMRKTFGIRYEETPPIKIRYGSFSPFS